MKKGLVPKPETKFLIVKCKDCGNSQTIFNRATTSVNCAVCGATMARPTGGKAKLQEGCEVQGEVSD
jgi:small subunit ribosomal protein S27e